MFTLVADIYERVHTFNGRRIYPFNKGLRIYGVVFWQKEHVIRLLLIVENSKTDYLKVFLAFRTY